MAGLAKQVVVAEGLKLAGDWERSTVSEGDSHASRFH